MGKRGPMPTPSAILKLRGSWRAKARRREPQPRAGRPACPTWLPPAARRKWRQLVPELVRLGLLTVVDGDALAAYCCAWAELQQATQTLDQEGRYVRLASGYLLSHPAVAQQRSAWQAVRAFAALFGLDPSSRTRLAATAASAAKEQKTGASALARFLAT